MNNFAVLIEPRFFAILKNESSKRQEGLFAHVAARHGLFLLSPSIEDRKNQNACESLPLNMEPVSGMYTNGLAVLDFKSLYPSVMIGRDSRTRTCHLSDLNGRVYP